MVGADIVFLNTDLPRIMSQPVSQKPQSAISPQRTEDFPEWYQQVIRAADMAENSEVRGCMVIKPWGYGIWEHIQQQLDRMFKATGHTNAYFPLLIPLSYLEKEAAHVEGFAKECAVVTHHRLESQKQPDGTMKMVPTGALTEPYVIRPTSETIIGAAFARWVHSYRDLPLLINQWANVMRWEMRPRIFLRTAEFLWQEGHTAHETKEEALEETERMLHVYEEFVRDHLAIPVIKGEKSERERFPGADITLCIEAMVQDRKAIQAGTSHFLGQHFSEAAGIQFTGRSGAKEYAWTTSWGVSTRLIGTLIMAHSDDDGLVLPPRVAPQQVVILPVTPKEETRAAVLEACQALAASLRAQTFAGEPVRVQVDTRDLAGGTKNWEWIKKGVPVRVEIGPRDLEKGSVAVSRRDRGLKEKEFLATEEFVSGAVAMLTSVQDGLLARATVFRDANMVKIDTLEAFEKYFTAARPEKPEIHGGFALCHWAGSAEDEDRLQKELGVTMRCMPFGDEYREEGVCFLTGAPSVRRVIFAKAY
jgi:prolyl-tRNA synthetase